MVPTQSVYRFVKQPASYTSNRASLSCHSCQKAGLYILPEKMHLPVILLCITSLRLCALHGLRKTRYSETHISVKILQIYDQTIALLQ